VPLARLPPANDESRDLHGNALGGGCCCERYRLVGADLCDMNATTSRLELAGIQRDVPTFILSECVLTYVNPSASAEVLRWAASYFAHCFFVTYEQVYPQDPFGLVMQRHFDHLGVCVCVCVCVV